MTPKQCRLAAAAMEAGEPMDHTKAIELLRAHAAALEEIERLNRELSGVKEYREKNPLGGPAKVFDAMADCIRAGDDFNKVIADYGWCPVDRAERAEAALAECRTKLEADPRTKYDGIDCRDETIRLLESALAEAERKCERLKTALEKVAADLEFQATFFVPGSHVAGRNPYAGRTFDALRGAASAIRAEFKEE